MKILPEGLSCSTRIDRRTDGQTDTTKLIVTFRNFKNSPKMIFSRKNILWIPLGLEKSREKKPVQGP